MPTARAKLPIADGYKSDVERAWATTGAHYLMTLYLCPVAVMYYEPLSVNLPGGRYTPDFLAIMENGLLVFVECKGSKSQRGYRDARAKLRAAAALCPWAEWVEARGGGGRFEVEVINCK